MNRQIIFEFIPIGSYVKVIAFDVETKVEISTITPRNISQAEQQRAAENKLLYILKKNHEI
ncbi:MAG: hypothetical protein KBB83_08245 [Alphaproteobacteria bacterium]|nr:hypothetical protein [Alphaproteobacteria bacterium]